MRFVQPADGEGERFFSLPTRSASAFAQSDYEKAIADRHGVPNGGCETRESDPRYQFGTRWK